MAPPRERAIDRLRGILESSGFYVSDTHAVRPTSFDLIARRDSLLVLIKVLKNIDSLDATEAARLLELANLFPASAVVVGSTSGSSRLESGVVYNRYGVPIVTEETLQDLLHEGVPPFLFSSPGGIFARIDGLLLRSLREARGLSLGALASVAGVSRRTVQLYESGAGAEVEVVRRIERFLQEPVALPIELFPSLSPHGKGPKASGPESTDRRAAPKGSADASEPDEERSTKLPTSRHPTPTGDPLRDGVLRQLDGMGWEVVVTVRAPFDAFNREPERTEREVLLTAVGSLRSASHRADLLSQLARVAEVHALYVVAEGFRRGALVGLPVLSMQELRRHRDRQELLETLDERSAL